MPFGDDFVLLHCFSPVFASFFASESGSFRGCRGVVSGAVLLPVCYPWGWEVSGTPCFRAFREGVNIGGVVNLCVPRAAADEREKGTLSGG